MGIAYFGVQIVGHVEFVLEKGGLLYVQGAVGLEKVRLIVEEHVLVIVHSDLIQMREEQEVAVDQAY